MSPTTELCAGSKSRRLGLVNGTLVKELANFEFEVFDRCRKSIGQANFLSSITIVDTTMDQVHARTGNAETTQPMQTSGDASETETFNSP